MFSFLELAEEDCFGHAYAFHPCDVANPGQLDLKQDGLYTGQVGFLEDFFILHVVLPFDAKDETQAVLIKPLESPDLLPIENPGLCTVQEGGKAEQVTVPYSFTVFQGNCWPDGGIFGDDATQVSEVFHCV